MLVETERAMEELVSQLDSVQQLLFERELALERVRAQSTECAVAWERRGGELFVIRSQMHELVPVTEKHTQSAEEIESVRMKVADLESAQVAQFQVKMKAAEEMSAMEAHLMSKDDIIEQCKHEAVEHQKNYNRVSASNKFLQKRNDELVTKMDGMSTALAEASERQMMCFSDLEGQVGELKQKNINLSDDLEIMTAEANVFRNISTELEREWCGRKEEWAMQLWEETCRRKEQAEAACQLTREKEGHMLLIRAAEAHSNIRRSEMVEQFTASLEERSNDCSRLQQQLDQLEEQHSADILEKQYECDRLLSELNDVEEFCKKLLEDREEECEQLKKQLQRSEEKMKELNGKQEEFVELQEQMDAMDKYYTTVISEKESEISSMSAQLRSLKTTHKRLCAEKEKYSAEFEEQIKEFETQLIKKQAECAHLEEQLDDAHEGLVAALSQIGTKPKDESAK